MTPFFLAPFDDVAVVRPETVETAPVAAGLPVDADAAAWGPPLVHVGLMFTTMRATEAVLWPNPFADFDGKRIGERYAATFTRPPLFDPDKAPFEWDGDRWTINVLGHGLMGSELYMRARTCHFGPWGAFAFAAGASAVWEYAFEGNGVRPSALDLVYTPLSSVFFGEGRYLVWRAADGIASPTVRAVVRAAVDPFGEAERATGMFGC